MYVYPVAFDIDDVVWNLFLFCWLGIIWPVWIHSQCGRARNITDPGRDPDMSTAG